MEVMAGAAIELSDKEFDMFRKLVYAKSGISLHDGKKELVRTRLGSRLRKGGFDSYMDYYRYVENDPTEKEIVNLLDAISTNLTSFFREKAHFDFLVKTVIPQTVEIKRAKNEKEVRVWSAGCSSGEEPYSLAFTLMDNMETIQTWDIKILATDLSTQALDHAIRGIYKSKSFEGMSANVLRKYFQKGENENEGFYRVRPEAKKLVHFKRLNLMIPRFPFIKKFSFIFCRNVMIYFDKITQQKLVAKYYDVLEDNGYLFIGHSESLTSVDHQFKYMQPTIYRKEK